MNPVQYYKKFMSYAKGSNGPWGLGSFLKYLHLRIQYKLSMKDFFDYDLYDSSIDHSVYYKSLHTAIHKWGYVRPKFMPNVSPLQNVVLKVDYLFSKILYPGLDAMDYFRYEFYNIRRNKRKTFITEGYLVKMDNAFNGGKEKQAYVHMLKDKGQFNQQFHEFIPRKWILAKDALQNEIFEFCKGLDKVIIKPIDGGAGQGIYIYEIHEEDDIYKLYEKVKDNNVIIEEVLVQHESIGKLNPSSVNTIRVYSVYSDQNVYITGGTLRIGCGDKPIDNYSAGGLAAEIDVETGLVISPAVSQNADKHYVHPYTGVPIIGFEIPYWREIMDTVKSAHMRISMLGYIGWDVVVCADNKITFLEANTCSGVELQQHPGLRGKLPIYKQYLKNYK